MLELTPDEESECEACDLEKMKCEGDGLECAEITGE